MRRDFQIREDNLIVVPMAREHIASCVAIHRDSFKDSYLSSLGNEFLTLMYWSFLNDPRESALVCVRAETGQVVGFVCGSQDWDAYLKDALRRYLPRALPLLFMASLRRPRVAKGLLKRSRMLKEIIIGRFVRPQRKAPELPKAALMSIAVERDYLSRGVGERLLRAYMDLMKNRGVAAIKLSVLDSNRAAWRLYQRLGWKSVAAVSSMAGESSHYYVCYLTDPTA